MKGESGCEWASPKRIQGQGGEGDERMGWHLPGNAPSATLRGKSRNKFHIALTRTRNIFPWVSFIKHYLRASSVFLEDSNTPRNFFFFLKTKKRCRFRRNMEINVPGSMAELYPSMQETWCAPGKGFWSKVQVQDLQLLPHPGQVLSDLTWWDGTLKIKSTNKTIN